MPNQLDTIQAELHFLRRHADLASDAEETGKAQSYELDHSCSPMYKALAVGWQWRERKRTFISGATDFVGTHLVRRMARTEHDLVCLVRKTSDVMSRDQVRTMKVGFVFDGSKAERGLKITYTPVRVALEEAIASYQEGG